jgi:hypothetical protein
VTKSNLDRWHNAPDLRLWEAAALWCGLDPTLPIAELNQQPDFRSVYENFHGLIKEDRLRYKRTVLIDPTNRDDGAFEYVVTKEAIADIAKQWNPVPSFFGRYVSDPQTDDSRSSLLKELPPGIRLAIAAWKHFYSSDAKASPSSKDEVIDWIRDRARPYYGHSIKPYHANLIASLLDPSKLRHGS